MPSLKCRKMLGCSVLTTDIFHVRRQVLFPAFVFLAALIALLVPLPEKSVLFDELQNSGHSLLFGILSLVSLHGLGNIKRTGQAAPGRRYLLAFLATICFGVLAETAQQFTGRDADPYDVLMDTVGALSFLCLYWTIDPAQVEFWKRAGRWSKLSVRSASGLVLATAFIVPVMWSVALLNRNHDFPLICDFDDYLSTRFVTPQESALEVVPAHPAWDFPDGKVGKVVFTIGAYPGIRIDEPYPDWRGYKALFFSIYSENDDTLQLGLRIDDSHHNLRPEDRFDTRFIVLPGMNRLTFPLEKIRLGPVSRETDMAHIANVVIFSSHPARQFVLYFGTIGLR